MTGSTEGVIIDPGDAAKGISPTTMFVAIDVSSTASSITLDVNGVSNKHILLNRLVKKCSVKN
jgi:hypothetical protein